MRLVLIGAPASGKSTLARQLSQHFGVPHLEVDRYFSSSTGILDEEALETQLRRSHWIIEGHFQKVSPLLQLHLPDSIGWICPPLAVCLFRALRRARATPSRSLWEDLGWTLRKYGIQEKYWDSLLKLPTLQRAKIWRKSSGEAAAFIEFLSPVQSALRTAPDPYDEGQLTL